MLTCTFSPGTVGVGGGVEQTSSAGSIIGPLPLLRFFAEDLLCDLGVLLVGTFKGFFTTFLADALDGVWIGVAGGGIAGASESLPPVSWLPSDDVDPFLS